MIHQDPRDMTPEEKRIALEEIAQQVTVGIKLHTDNPKAMNWLTLDEVETIILRAYALGVKDCTIYMEGKGK